MTNSENRELEALLVKRDSLNKEEMERYRELLKKKMEEDLYLGDPNS